MKAGRYDEESGADDPRMGGRHLSDSRAADRCAMIAKGRPRRRLTPQRLMFNFCKVAAVVVVLAVIGAGVLALRLQAGPIAIDGLGEKIASALHERFGKDLDFALGQASVVQRGFGPTLAIDRLVVTGPGHQTILSAPKAEISIDPFALLFGRVSPKRLEVMDVTLRLVLLENGALAVAAGDGTTPFLEIGRRSGPDAGAAAPTPAAAGATPAETRPDETAQADDAPLLPKHRAIVMKQASAAIRQFLDILTDPHGAVGAVDRLGITRGRLVIDDKLNAERVVYSDFDLSFGKAGGATNLTLSAVGPNGRWTVAAMAKGRPGRERSFGLKAENLTIDEAQLIAGTRSLGIETDMPIAFSADIALKPDNTLAEAAGQMKLGPGFLRTSDPDQSPIFIDELTSALHWDAANRTIVVDPSRYVEGKTSFTLVGAVRPPRDEGNPWAFDVAMQGPGRLAPDRKGQVSFALDRGELKGQLFLDRKTFQLDRLAIHSNEGGIALAGTIDWLNGPHVKLGAQIDPTSVRFAERVWPESMAASVRAWVIDHFEAGELTSGTIRIDYDALALKRLRADRPPPDGSVALDFTLSKGRLRFLEGIPPLENIEGVGHITGRTSRFVVKFGTLDADGRKIVVSDTEFKVANNNMHPIPAVLTARLTGDVEAVTDLLSRDALKDYASLPLDASTLHGRITGTLEKEILLGTHEAHPDLPMRVSAKVSNFVAERIVGKENLEDCDLSLDVGDGRLEATGQGRIFGGPATFHIERTGTDAPVAQIAITLDDAARSKLGLSAIPGLTGPMTAHVNASLGDPSKIKAKIDLDLAKTAVAIGYLGVNKPAGRPAKVSFALEPRDGRLSIEQLVVDIAALQARGAVELDGDNGFRSAKFSSFRVSPGDDMHVDVAKGDDTFKLTIRGSTVDARPFLKGLTSTPKDDSTPLARSAKAEKKEAESFKGFDIDLKAGILTGFNKEVMNAVDLKLSKRGSQYRQFAVHGRFGGDTFSGSMGANQRIDISARDAGSLLSFIDLYKHMEGGNLTVAMQMTDDAVNGNLEIRDFVLRDEPAIRRLVAQTETSVPVRDGQATRKINAGAVVFQRLKVNFERAGSRIQLHDATMYGNEIGLSVDGWLDYIHNRVGMSGTFVPVFALNNVFAQIPVVGAFLGGRQNEGLFAITFRITGNASSPTLSVNPLSAIAPGFLRNIFGAIEPGGVPITGGGDDTEPSR